MLGAYYDEFRDDKEVMVSDKEEWCECNRFVGSWGRIWRRVCQVGGLDLVVIILNVTWEKISYNKGYKISDNRKCWQHNV